MASSRTSSSGQQAPGQESEDPNRMTTHHGRPSVKAILNSVLPHWDGSLTLPLTFAIQSHRNMLLQVFWHEEKLRPITGNAAHAAPDALPAVPDPSTVAGSSQFPTRACTTYSCSPARVCTTHGCNPARTWTTRCCIPSRAWTT